MSSGGCRQTPSSGWDKPSKAKFEDDPNTPEEEEVYKPPVLARCKVRFPNTGSG